MRKTISHHTALFPLPVLLLASYDEAGTPHVMNVAWASLCDMDKVILFLSEGHKNTKNILKNKAFSLSLVDEAHMAVADYAGLVSGNHLPDKFSRTGLRCEEGQAVHAPILPDLPLTMECELVEVIDSDTVYALVGQIHRVTADETVLDEQDRVIPEALHAICFDSFRTGYYRIGEKVGQAFREGKNREEN